MTIDMHVHLADKRIYSDTWLKHVRNSISDEIKKTMNMHAGSEIIDYYLNNALADYDCSKLIAQMDEAGIDKSTLLLIDFDDTDSMDPEPVIQIHYQALNAYKDRFNVFAGVAPRRGEKGIRLFKRCIHEYGFSGVKLYPPCGYEIDDPGLYPYYEICNHYRLPVLIHIGPSWPGMKSVFNYPEAILKVSKEFPRTPFILGHAALLHYESSRNLPLLRDNIYLETSGYRKILTDRKLIEQRLEKLFKDCPEKVIYGSDYPMFGPPGREIMFLKNMGVLNKEQLDLLFYKNAMRIFSMGMKE
jgi:predicted TIM-barrel fold metal-dependent hydrolase